MSLERTSHGYSYIPGVFQYSAGVVAQPGFRIERVTFDRVLPVEVGFARAAQYLQSVNLPLAAFCACELRSPEPFTEDGFLSFNADYVGILSAWGVLEGDRNPVARSNVCPLVNPPDTPSLYAFAFAVPTANADGSFIIAGGAEAPEGQGSYREHTVCFGDVSPKAIAVKGAWVIKEMERRMEFVGKTWADTSAVQLYTVHDVHHFVADSLAAKGIMDHGLIWHLSRPPLEGLEYEMDCRRVTVERMAAV